ncbi:hypothetical protein J32TS6_01370 [Virgibacillus pantothenticus]|nr:hypothetical protein J32TS6_01370 [Virgibacillus pantothenticus]
MVKCIEENGKVKKYELRPQNKKSERGKIWVRKEQSLSNLYKRLVKGPRNHALNDICFISIISFLFEIIDVKSF